jgi:hypothetical protein
LNVDLYIDARTHRGPCDTNIGQSFVLHGLWTVPGLQASHGIAQWITNGWQLGGIFNASTGSPFSVTIGGDPLGTQAAIPFDFPDRLKGPGCGSLTTGKPGADIKLSCFAFPNPVNRMGNAGRNELIGPNLVDLDVSAFKNAPLKWISEGANLQFRLEVYNILNHTNFSAPTDHFQIFDGSGASVQFAGQVDQTTTTSRQIQLAVKLTF